LFAIDASRKAGFGLQERIDEEDYVLKNSFLLNSSTFATHIIDFKTFEPTAEVETLRNVTHLQRSKVMGRST